MTYSLLLAMIITCNFAFHAEAFEHDAASKEVTVYGSFFSKLKNVIWKVAKTPLSMFYTVVETLDDPTTIV